MFGTCSGSAATAIQYFHMPTSSVIDVRHSLCFMSVHTRRRVFSPVCSSRTWSLTTSTSGQSCPRAQAASHLRFLRHSLIVLYRSVGSSRASNNHSPPLIHPVHCAAAVESFRHCRQVRRSSECSGKSDEKVGTGCSRLWQHSYLGSCDRGDASR